MAEHECCPCCDHIDNGEKHKVPCNYHKPFRHEDSVRGLRIAAGGSVATYYYADFPHVPKVWRSTFLIGLFMNDHKFMMNQIMDNGAVTFSMREIPGIWTITELID
jgi:hypothetical protein